MNSTAGSSPELLRPRIEGRVITPETDGFDEARRVFRGDVDRRPKAIIKAAGATDVARVIRFARATGTELAVRAGGHSTAGHSATEGGLVLDLRELRGLTLDLEHRTAWAESGLSALELTQATAAHGLAVGLGDTGSVGVAGITLGGGIGYLVRKHGLTIDSLQAAEIVTADGELRRIDDHREPDLFWAIRGGGGNFGVVTRFQFRLQDVSSVLGGLLVLPPTPAVIAGFVAAAEAAPEELSAIANITIVPPAPFLPRELHGKLAIIAFLAHVGDLAAGARAVAPFRALAPPIADMLRPMSYPALYPPEPPGFHPNPVQRTMFLDRVDLATARTILRFLERSDAAVRTAQLRVLGGAMARVPAEATAFAHRRSRILAVLTALYDGTAEDRARHQSWVKAFAAAIQQEDRGAYVNFLMDEGAARVRAAYPGPTWDRLVAVKRRYDPTNLFRLNQNIPPAA